LQSQKQSLIESAINVGTGAVIAFILNLYLLPHFIDDIANQVMTTAILIGVIYTAVSMLRSYLFRRCFNKIENNKVYIRNTPI
tara:strand:- start:12893 stop:13141 length:249 start_codon:yes stop_codon:yes gene_type:complete